MIVVVLAVVNKQHLDEFPLAVRHPQHPVSLNVSAVVCQFSDAAVCKRQGKGYDACPYPVLHSFVADMGEGLAGSGRHR